VKETFAMANTKQRFDETGDGRPRVRPEAAKRGSAPARPKRQAAGAAARQGPTVVRGPRREDGGPGAVAEGIERGLQVHAHLREQQRLLRLAARQIEAIRKTDRHLEEGERLFEEAGGCLDEVHEAEVHLDVAMMRLRGALQQPGEAVEEGRGFDEAEPYGCVDGLPRREGVMLIRSYPLFDRVADYSDLVNEAWGRLRSARDELGRVDELVRTVRQAQKHANEVERLLSGSQPC
jgi:hypothetical protein